MLSVLLFVIVNLNTLMLIFTHKNVKLQLDLVSTAVINAATPQDKKLKARDREHSQSRLFPLMSGVDPLDSFKTDSAANGKRKSNEI